jgi:putative transcriptional regulator
MQIELSNNFKGKCLIAMPSIQDEIFAASVVYVTEHNSINGAVGVIINKNLPLKKNHLSNLDFAQYNHHWRNIPLFFGGPVELSTGFVLHSNSKDGHWSLTGSKEKIKELAAIDKIRPLMLTAGYCMWETLQLEREVRFNNWLVLENAAEFLLADTSPEERYQVALRLVGINSMANFDFNGSGNA